MVWKLGGSGSAICSVRSRMSSGSGSGGGGGSTRGGDGGSGGAAARGGGDGGTGVRGGIAAGLGAAAAGGGGTGGGAGFVSSSAMIRRMEARISSIDGSCAFAGWLIADFPAQIPRALRPTDPDPAVSGESLT